MTSEPFLNPSTSDLICLICGNTLSLRPSSKIQFKNDLTKLRSLAGTWKQLDIAENDSLLSFSTAHTRLTSRSNGYVHKNCQINFRTKHGNYNKKPDRNDEHLDIDLNSANPKIPIPSYCTRSIITSPISKEICFVCNKKTETIPFRISQVSVVEKAENAKKRHLENYNSPFHNSAKRLDIMSQSAVDIFAADIYYHNACFQNFCRFPRVKEEDPTKSFVKEYFCNYVRLRICTEKNAYLLSDLLNDSVIISEEHNIEPIFTCTKSLKRHLESNVSDIGFSKDGKFVIVYPLDIDPVMYSKSILKGHGLRISDIIRSFAKMIHRVTNSYVEQRKNFDWPSSVDELISSLKNDNPLPELYNTIFLTINRQWENSVGLNEYGFAKTQSNNLAKKIWSIASDWTALLTGLMSPKQISLGLYIHRLVANKEVSTVLWKAGHIISLNDVRHINDIFLNSSSEMENMLSGLVKNTVTHASFDNNDKCQDTNTGKGTTHHTNFLLFQPTPTKNSIPVISSNLDKFTSEVVSNQNFKIGKLVPPPLTPEYIDIESKNLIEYSFEKNILWSLVGGLPNDDQDELPLMGSWTAFMKNTCSKETAKSLLNYLPANENPPEHSVCKEFLEFLIEIMGSLDIPHIFVHADEQVYARVVQLIWKYKEKFKNIIPIMGGFHQLRVFQKILYKRHGVIGYKDWLWDSGVVAEGSAPAAIKGRHYYRSMRVHKEAFDALSQYRIEEITNNYLDLDVTLKELLKKLRSSPSNTLVEQALEHRAFKQMTVKFKCTSGNRSKMTMTYLKDVSLMLSIVAAVREGNFEKHLQSERQFLKLVFAFDHVHYARYNTYQHLLLTNLKTKNEPAFQDLMLNDYGCTTNEKSRFAAKHYDLETEHFNRETKGGAGPFRAGFSTNIDSVNRWIKTAHIHSKLRKATKQHFRLITSSVHKEMTSKNKKIHYQHVSSLKQKLRDYNAEPFGDGQARNIVTGKEINEKIINGLLEAEKTGNDQFVNFVSDRFISGNKTFFEVVSRNKIDTGLEKTPKKTKKIDILLEEKQAFGVMISKCNSKEEGFSYPMTSLPLSIATPSGFLYSSNKSKFRNDLIGNNFTNEPNCNSTWIVDAGYALHQVKPCDTYRQFFHALFNWMLPDRKSNPSSVVIAIDDYRKRSTKELERRCRRTEKDEGRRTYVKGLEQKMPKEKRRWAEFLTNGENKNDLFSLFENYVNSEEGLSQAEKLDIILVGRTKVFKNGREIFECNHEEADTKIPLFASKSTESVVAVAQDCDILILLITAYATLKPSVKWQMKYTNELYANIDLINDELGDEACRYLSQFHAISGCDTTSYFFGLGKTKPFKRALHSNKLKLLDKLGKTLEISNDCITECKEFIRVVLYKGMPDESYLQTRLRLYDNQNNASKTTLSLPPDEDSCCQHILRAHCISFIWNNFDKNIIPTIDPYSNGWELKNGISVPVWFVGPQCPPTVHSHKKKKKVDGYDADDEDGRKRKYKRINKTVIPTNISTTVRKKKYRRVDTGRKFRQHLTTILTEDNETNENPDVTPDLISDNCNEDADNDSSNGEEVHNTDNTTDEWEHFSDFDDSDADTSDSDWI